MGGGRGFKWWRKGWSWGGSLESERGEEKIMGTGCIYRIHQFCLSKIMSLVAVISDISSEF